MDDQATPPPASTPSVENSSGQPVPGSPQEKNLGLICHLLSLCGLLVSVVGIPPIGLNIIGPLVLWLLKKAESPYLDAHGKEVLNFNISWSIYMGACFVGFILLVWILIGFLFLPLMFILGVAWLIFVIIGSIKASEGKLYRYPLTIRFIA